MNSLVENVTSVQKRLKKAMEDRTMDSHPVNLMAVSKTRTVEEIETVSEAGITDFGENYLQEALEKINALKHKEIVWHFIGSIQSNKTTSIAEHFQWVHTVDRLKIAKRLNEQRPDHYPALNVCIQVNIDNESTKAGVSPAEVEELSNEISQLQNLSLRGLMFIPKAREDKADQIKVCTQARALFDQVKRQHNGMDTLSLGMSADFEAAVEAGSSMVRVGTDIFGKRPIKTN